MKLLPFETIVLVSPHDTEHLISRIENSIVPPNRITDKEFEGHVDGNFFEISRILKSGRNSFIPIAKGEVFDFEGKTVVNIKLSLHKWVLTILSIFILFDLSLIYFSVNWEKIVFLLLPYLVTIGFYNIEANTAKIFLKEIIE